MIERHSTFVVAPIQVPDAKPKQPDPVFKLVIPKPEVKEDEQSLREHMENEIFSHWRRWHYISKDDVHGISPQLLYPDWCTREELPDTFKIDIRRVRYDHVTGERISEIVNVTLRKGEAY